MAARAAPAPAWDQPPLFGQWLIGVRYRDGRAQRWRWVNKWMAHPCRDLVEPFELGTRAFHQADWP